MPRFRVNVTAKHKGMLFDAGKSKAAAQRAVIRANEALAVETVIRIQNRLDQVLQNPTGYYRSNIKVTRRSVYRGVSDSGVVYGGYLEGIAKNNRTTRFKGYRTFRTVQQSIAQDKERIVAPEVKRLVRELNG